MLRVLAVYGPTVGTSAYISDVDLQREDDISNFVREDYTESTNINRAFIIGGDVNSIDDKELLRCTRNQTRAQG